MGEVEKPQQVLIEDLRQGGTHGAHAYAVGGDAFSEAAGQRLRRHVGGVQAAGEADKEVLPL